MKPKSFIILPAGVAAVLIAPLLALEPPADEAPPPPVVANDAGLPEIKLPAPEAKMDSAFLGVVSGEIPEVLAEHLKLQSDGGVLVRSLVPDGPAQKSGIAVNDIIVKVGGEPVGSPQEISERITAHKPGEKVAVEIIHKGEMTTLDVTLGARPAELAVADPNRLEQLDLEGLPRELAERFRNAIEGNIGPFDLGDDAAKVPQQMEEALRQLQQRLDGGADPANPNDAPAPGAQLQMRGEANVRMNDAQGSVEVKAKDGAKIVTLRDQQGEVTWKGPWDTAQDKAAAPADVRERVESLNIDDTFKGGGLRFQMRQLAPPNNGQE